VGGTYLFIESFNLYSIGRGIHNIIKSEDILNTDEVIRWW
jgi:hypothetical protein